MTTWTDLPTGTSGEVRIPEDILSRDGGVLRRRGRLLFQYDHTTGFPNVRQHYGGVTPRNPISMGGYPKGLIVTGRGTAADGYGSQSNGAGIYKNMDRFQEDVWYTVSGRFAMIGEEAGAVTDFGLHMDTQGWDETVSRRNYPQVHWDSGARKWKIRGGGVWHDIPGATYFPGFNENKFQEFFVAFSFKLAKSTPTQPHPAYFGEYGHFQIAGQSFDLRGLGAAWANYAPQIGTPEDSFAGGYNIGVSAATPLPGKVGGFSINRLEVSVGDVLN